MKARIAGQKPKGTTASGFVGTARSAHLRESESRLLDAVCSAVEVATSAAFNLIGNSATDDVFLQLLGDSLHRFHTEVERPEEYLLLRNRNVAVPLAFDIAAERAQGLASLCEKIEHALLTEQLLLSTRPKDSQRIADSLQDICEAAHTLCGWVQIYPSFPKESTRLSATLQSATRRSPKIPK
jgi:hypothetical protein